MTALDAWNAFEAELPTANPTDLPAVLAPIGAALVALDRGERPPAPIPGAAGAVVAAALGERPNIEGLKPWIQELITLFVDARRGLVADPGPALAAATTQRPIVHAAAQLLADPGTGVFRSPLVAHLSPRADQLQLCARVVQLAGALPAGFLAQNFPSPVLDLSEWTDLDGRAQAAELAAWAGGEGGFSEAHERAVDVLMRCPDAPRGAVVGRMLRRIAGDLDHGRVSGLAAPALAAWRLAAAARLPVADPIGAAALRIERVDPLVDAPHAELLTGLWRDRARFDAAEAREIARALLIHRLDADPDDLLAALGLLLATAPFPEADALLRQYGNNLDDGALRDLLAAWDASPVRREALTGALAGARGGLQEAAWAVGRLLTQGAPEEALAVLSAAARAVADHPEGARYVADAARAIHAIDLPAATWAGWLTAAPLRQHLSADPDDPARRAALRAVGPATSPVDGAAGVFVAAALEDPERAAAAVTAIGRRLQRGEALAATAEALTIIAAWGTWDARLGRTLIDGVGRPITLFLTRQGGRHVAAALDAAALAGLERGALAWFLASGQDVAPDAAFRRLIRPVLRPPDVLGPAFDEVVAATDLRAVRAIEDLPAALNDGLRSAAERVGAPRRARPGVPRRFPDRRALPLVSHIEGALPVARFDGNGHPVDDPWETLGVGRGASRDEILAAWRGGLHSGDADATRRAREARDRLLDPRQVLIRELGEVSLPDPEAWGLSGEIPEVPNPIPAWSRLAGQLVLHALVEAELWEEGLAEQSLAFAKAHGMA
jgi:hypothetical protein